MAVTAALSPLDANLPHPLPAASRRLDDGKPPRAPAPAPRRQSDYHLIQSLRAVPPSALSPKPTTTAAASSSSSSSSTADSSPPRKPRPLPAAAKPKTPHKPLHKKYLCATPPAFLRNKRRNLTYDRGRQLGEGGFARCFLVQNKEGKLFAAKTVAKQSLGNPRMKQKFFGEIQVQKMMRHPNVVRFNECFEDENNVYLILELCPNKSLVEMLRRRTRLTEPEARHIALQLFGALKYMHYTKRVIHRDLKLGNIFLDAHMNVKIGDFGLAARLVSASDRKTTMCGTPNYIAPEVLFGSKSRGGDGSGHSFEVDLWSMGVIIYALLVGKPPFQAKEVEEIYKNIKECRVGFPEDCSVSGNARALVRSLLHTDPERRPGIDSAVEHPWFRQGWFPRAIPETALVKEPAPASSASASQMSTASAPGAMDAFPTAPDLSLAVGAPVQNTSSSSILDSLHSHIAFLTAALTTLSTPTTSSARAKEEMRLWRSGAKNKSVFITKWVDYTNKFGIGYVLTDGTVGVMFNDNSGIVCDGGAGAGETWYLTQGRAAHAARRTTPGGAPPGGVETVYRKYTTHMPTLLRERSAMARMGGGLVVNKVGMWRRFGAFMRDNLEGGEDYVFAPARSGGGAGFGAGREMVFVTNYARMKDGAVFRFSSGGVQMVSVDHTKIVLEQGGVVRFLGRKGRLWVLGGEEVRQVVAASSSSAATTPAGGQLRREEVRELREEGLEGRLAFLRGFLRGWWREGRVPGVRRRVGQGGGVREEGERSAREEVVVLGEVDPGE
ncbi:kinase-like domain-containing protein [Tirmania nivea]|nr:kinase-like domain-containing protein [Tirmania nivea]